MVREKQLDALLGKIWKALLEGVISNRSPFHTAVVATAAGELPDARMVVLRRVDSATRMLCFHTDWRSAKRLQIEANNRVTWVFYDPQLRIQVRAVSHATVHHLDELARREWEEISPTVQANYMTLEPPGTPQSEAGPGLPPDVQLRRPTSFQTAGAFRNFCTVRTIVEEFDWLYLAADGHRRARFVLSGPAATMTWTTP